MLKMKTQRLLIAAFAFCSLCLIQASRAEAFGDDRWRTWSIDAGATTSTGPGSEWESGSGASLGLTYRLSPGGGLRLSYEQHRFNNNNNNALTFSRKPLFLGGRLYFWNMGDIWSHTEVGLEMSFDKREYLNTSGVKVSETTTNVGGAIQYGMLYEITNSLFMGANVKVHLNKSNYWTYGINLGMIF